MTPRVDAFTYYLPIICLMHSPWRTWRRILHTNRRSYSKRGDQRTRRNFGGHFGTYPDFGGHFGSHPGLGHFSGPHPDFRGHFGSHPGLGYPPTDSGRTLPPGAPFSPTNLYMPKYGRHGRLFSEIRFYKNAFLDFTLFLATFFNTIAAFESILPSLPCLPIFSIVPFSL